MHATLSFWNSCRITLLLTSTFGIPAGKPHQPALSVTIRKPGHLQCRGLVYLKTGGIKRSFYTESCDSDSGGAAGIRSGRKRPGGVSRSAMLDRWALAQAGGGHRGNAGVKTRMQG